MKVFRNKDLKDFNQYGVNAQAKYFIEIKNEDDINELVKSGYLNEEKILILGEGNNILFCK
jgi:UDP-N-acetylmuramate dehydrogenase